MASISEDYLANEGPLSPADAVAAIILLENDSYLLQLRDMKPGIFFPGHWGLFGGAIDAGETPEAALRRELSEELGLNVGTPTYFTKLTIDFAPHGFDAVTRYYYEVRVSPRELQSVVLGEGREMRSFDGDELIKIPRVTPYDSFALWLHLTQRFYSNCRTQSG